MIELLIPPDELKAAVKKGLKAVRKAPKQGEWQSRAARSMVKQQRNFGITKVVGASRLDVRG
jgi:hypothetical protein